MGAVAAGASREVVTETIGGALNDAGCTLTPHAVDAAFDALEAADRQTDLDVGKAHGALVVLREVAVNVLGIDVDDVDASYEATLMRGLVIPVDGPGRWTEWDHDGGLFALLYREIDTDCLTDPDVTGYVQAATAAAGPGPGPGP